MVLLLAAAIGLLPAGARAGISIEMVTVGDPGNVGELSGRPDLGTERLCGAVSYVYQIGKYEVTNAQYRQFLNSVARHGDPYLLWKSSGALRAIDRAGSGTVADPYAYLPQGSDPNWDTRPLNYVSWYTCLRFINWLQNGQPVAEAGPGVTETGTYTLSDPSSVTDEDGQIHTYYTVTIPDHAALTTPHYALPTEDEWYKAAYYKGGGTAAGYWDYATQSDTLPNNNPPELDTGNSANYSLVDSDPNTPWEAVGGPYYLTDVGAYSLSESAYRTYDQNGNVFEFLEEPSPFEGPPNREIRGSSWAYYQVALAAYERAWGGEPTSTAPDTGFRVAVVPEPSSAVAILLAWGVGLISRRGRVQP